MDVLEGGHWVVSLSQIPHIEAGVLVVIVGDDELSSKLRIPHHASPLNSFGVLLLTWVSKVGLRRG